MDKTLSRRLFTASTGGSLAAWALGCGGRPADAQLDAGLRSPAPPPGPSPLAPQASAAPLVCHATTEDIEGPFFKAGAPTRTALGSSGTPLVLEGRLLGPDCRPLRGSSLEVWHADARGDYDNVGFGFRARVPVDESGAFRIDTVVPGRYLNGRVYRPSHVHLKLHAPGARSLTTQLYFEGDPFNEVDPFVHASRIAPVERRSSGWRVVRDFVLA